MTIAGNNGYDFTQTSHKYRYDSVKSVCHFWTILTKHEFRQLIFSKIPPVDAESFHSNGQTRRS
jgi:hypothetical protein